jgi:ferredoxin
MDKKELLEQAARETTGLWVAGSLRSVQKAVLHAPGASLLPVEYPILDSPEVHEANLQINYGCPAFCSFCFEGYDRKPYRELSSSEVLSAARRIKQAQGNEELNLYSFNFNTHQEILEMILELHRLFDRVSLKSQRLDILQRAEILLEAEVEADKRNFTLGIEGISERQRAWLHKSLSTEEIAALLNRLLGLKIRRIKLFYILTGHETDEDIQEFRRFLKWLKEARRSQKRRVRVIFSFGLLIRMPFTPLRYDRLLLDERAWRLLIGQAKSACETNGFEFRLAFDWPTYCVTQVLALGGYWLVEPVVALAKKGYYFDTILLPTYWDELEEWMKRSGHWNDAFLGEKGADYPFALEFVESDISADFLYRQYQEAQSGKDSGHCLGSREQHGRCLGCGACVDEKQRRAITHHQIRQPDAERYLTQLREVMARKRRLQPTYFLLRLAPSLAGTLPEFLNAFVFREMLARYPELIDNLLSVRESLFTVGPNADRFPLMSGETVFALKAWDVEALERILAEPQERAGAEVQIVEPVEGFTRGAFTRLHLDMHLPDEFFPEPRVRLEQYLRTAYLPYSLRREDDCYRFDLPRKALKKKIMFAGFFETRPDGFFASLDVGPKFSLTAFLQTFGEENLSCHAQARVSAIEW